MSSELELAGRVVVITGAAGALGGSYARAFSSRGARLVLNDAGKSSRGDGFEPWRVEDLAGEVRAAGGEAIANSEDLTRPEGAQRLFEQTVAHYGRADALINNAGAMRDRVFKKMTLEDLEAVIAVNLMASIYVTHAFFPFMVERNFGRVVMTTSASGLYGVFGAANYAAAKMGIVGLMAALRLEGERHDVRVNAVAPVAASRLTESFVEPAVQARIRPEWVAPLVMLLASPNCPVNGEIFAAGGGYFSRAAVLEGQGVRFPGDVPVSPETLAERFAEIRDLSRARGFDDSLAAVKHAAGPA